MTNSWVGIIAGHVRFMQQSPRLHPRRTTWTLVVAGRTVRMWGFFTPSAWVEFWRADRRGEC